MIKRLVLAALECDAYKDWLQHCATVPAWTEKDFERAGSPSYLRTCCGYLLSHSSLESNPDAKTLLEEFHKNFTAAKGPLERALHIQAHWQCRDNQNARYLAVSVPSQITAGKRSLACDFGDIETLPQGPEMQTEDFFANMRLAFSMYAARVVDDHNLVWIMLVGRVMEKTSKYAIACLRHALSQFSWDTISALSLWSDGPKQFKSVEYMSTCANNIMLELQVPDVEVNYGCPKEWKGGWDRWIALLKGVLHESAKHRDYEEHQEVVTLWQQWASAEMDKHPHGPRYIVLDFMPEPKDKCATTFFRRKDFLGIEGNYAWSFRCNDWRAMERGWLGRVRGSSAELIYLRLRNHGLVQT